MSFEAIDEEPLLNEEPNLSTTAEEPKCKKPSCLVLSLIGVGITALVILIIGLSIGLSGKSDEKTVKPDPPNNLPSRTMPLTYTPYATPTNRPTEQQTSTTSSSSLTSTTTGFSPVPTQSPTQSSIPTQSSVHTPTSIPYSPSQSQYIPTHPPTQIPNIITDPPTPDVLPGCSIYPQMECQGKNSKMGSEYENHTFHTPSRNADGWRPGYQDMSVLVGYAQLKYKPGRKGCTVNIITRTKR